MKHYGHMCLKRTLVWSTASAISLLDLGPIKKGVHKSLVRTAQKYIDSKGKVRYKGAGKVLKNTQPLDFSLIHCLGVWMFGIFGGRLSQTIGVVLLVSSNLKQGFFKLMSCEALSSSICCSNPSTCSWSFGNQASPTEGPPKSYVVVVD